MTTQTVLSGSPRELHQISIRPLTGEDCNAYRALRQKILDIGDGRYFSDSYTREQQLTTDQLWRDWCTEKSEHCIMGTFADKELVGVMMITQQGQPDSPVVEWEATWLDPHYRSGGVAKAAYEQVNQWTLDQGYAFAAVFIRDDNKHSQDIRRKQGFVYAYTLYDEVWADGSVGNTHAFLLDLRGSTPHERHQQTVIHLKEALAHLNQGPHAPDPKLSQSVDPRDSTLATRREQTVRHLEEAMTILNEGPHVVPEQHDGTSGPARPGPLGEALDQKRLG